MRSRSGGEKLSDIVLSAGVYGCSMGAKMELHIDMEVHGDLLVVTARGTVTPDSVLRLLNAIRGSRVRLGFVGTPPAVTGFGVRIARNRGIAAEVFPSQQEALSWLEEIPAREDTEELIL
jgi:hypothetical protein